jgi:SAM-dependent methyltransferase
MSSRYSAAWEGFWSEAAYSQGDAIWDSDPDVTAATHVPIFEPYLDPSLPMLDLGCGNGTQTRYLATRYQPMIGIDLSGSAIERARALDVDKRVQFRLANVLDRGVPEALHQEFGDLNVYMRGIIHQSEPADRDTVSAAVATLIGADGRVFCLELAIAAAPLLRAIAGSPAGPPEKIQKMFKHGLTPAQIDDAALAGYVERAGIRIAHQGTLPLHSTLNDPATTLPYQFPMVYFIGQRRAR